MILCFVPHCSIALHLSFFENHPDPLTLRGEGGNRPTRCSEPLRSKVGGPSKVFAILCGMGPPYYSLLLVYARLCGMGAAE